MRQGIGNLTFVEQRMQKASCVRQETLRLQNDAVLERWDAMYHDVDFISALSALAEFFRCRIDCREKDFRGCKRAAHV